LGGTNEMPAPLGYSLCAEAPCPYVIPYAGEKLGAGRYCDDHRILFGLDKIDGSAGDVVEPTG
jgi:hypothetical protein